MIKLLQKGDLKDVLRSVIIAICVSIVGVLIFALVVKFLYLGENAVLIGNTVIKVISIFLGSFLGVKQYEKGAIKGIISGVCYIILSYFVFSLISGDGLFSGLDVVGVLFGAIVGVISGIITVNMHK